jgi:hypothetical protein
MNEIDLIPLDYRHSLRLRGWLQKFAIVLCCAVVCMVALKLGLDHRVRVGFQELAALQATEAMLAQQRVRLAELERERGDAQKRLSILDGLRGGTSSEALFFTVDDAFLRGIWFLDWTFKRAGEIVENDGKSARTGYFVVVPLDEPNQPNRAWRMDTHMEIRGQATDHSTLARFVSQLLDQPRIEQVRVVNTRVRAFAAIEVVDFELAVVVGTDA